MIVSKNPTCYTPSMSKKMSEGKKQKTSGKRGRGRPPVEDKRVSLRTPVNTSERAILVATASALGLPLQTWCRMSLLAAAHLTHLSEST